MRPVLTALCAIGIAATVGWMLAGVGESLPSAATLFGLSEPSAAESSGGIPIHIDSSPAGAQVQIDGKSFGLDKTPLDVRLSAGQHTLSLQHPEALDDERTIQVADTAATIDVALWRRRPDVIAVRPVYPGASLLDARFLNDGQVALLVGLPTSARAPDAGHELWRLDPVTGQLSRVEIPKTETAATTMVLAPDGDRVAYVTPSSSSAVTVTGWSTGPSGPTATPRETEPESVWLSRLDGTQPPRRIFGLPSASAPATSSNAEHVSGLVWTPDGSHLVAITRQTGAPVRARLFLLNVPRPGVTDSQLAADELVVLPAEVLPDSAVPAPSGRRLALVTRAAVAPAGQNLLNLCVLELKPAGTFRDVADLGSGTPSVATLIAWPPTAAASALEHLIFVAPAPATVSGNGGVFGIFGALRPSAPPSGLFMADLEASGLQDAQPRRLGSSTNHFGLVWRYQTALFGFGRQSDGTLALDSIDSTTGAVKDLGVRLPAGTAQGATALSVRWDALHGYALLLAHAADGGSSAASAGGGPLQAWLVSFRSPSAQAGLAH